MISKYELREGFDKEQSKSNKRISLNNLLVQRMSIFTIDEVDD